MKTLIFAILFFLSNLCYAQTSLSDTIEIESFAGILRTCFEKEKGRIVSDTLNRIIYNSKIVIRGTFLNNIYVEKDSAHNPCSYSAVIADNATQEEATILTRKWKRMLHTLLENEQAILYSNDHGFDLGEPINISYHLNNNSFDFTVYRIQKENRKYWNVGLFLTRYR